MDNKIQLSWAEFLRRLDNIDLKDYKYYGVVRGGMICCAFLKRGTVVTTPEEADIILDDIIDSGATLQKYQTLYPTKPFVAVVDKIRNEFDRENIKEWVVFPWQSAQDVENDIDDNIIRILQWSGIIVNDTNKIKLKEYLKLFSEYSQIS